MRLALWFGGYAIVVNETVIANEVRREAVEDLILIWIGGEAEEWRNRIQVLPL